MGSWSWWSLDFEWVDGWEGSTQKKGEGELETDSGVLTCGVGSVLHYDLLRNSEGNDKDGLKEGH